MKKIVLASRSPRRTELLKMITEDFSVCPSSFDEGQIEASSPAMLVRRLAHEKAKAVKKEQSGVIIGCDTVVAFENEIFGIPADRADAERMLTALSGKTHSVITGVCVLDGNNEYSFECETKVSFFPIGRIALERYLDSDEPYDKAGGYGIQGKAGIFVSGIEGDYYNVVGLPVSRLYRLLSDKGVL